MINETDMQKGIKYFLKNLRETGEGFLVDEDTFYAYVAMNSNSRKNKPFTVEERKQLENEIILEQKHIKGQKLLNSLCKFLYIIASASRRAGGRVLTDEIL